MSDTLRFDYDKKPYRNPEVIERLYWEEGLSQNDIAERFGISRRPVADTMEEHGIPRRSPGEAGKKAVRVEWASFYTGEGGYEAWYSTNPDTGQADAVKVHRLLAVSEYGFDSVHDRHIHHRNGIPWDNRSENIEPMTPSEHTLYHWEDRRK